MSTSQQSPGISSVPFTDRSESSLHASKSLRTCCWLSACTSTSSMSQIRSRSRIKRCVSRVRSSIFDVQIGLACVDGSRGGRAFHACLGAARATGVIVRGTRARDWARQGPWTSEDRRAVGCCARETVTDAGPDRALRRTYAAPSHAPLPPGRHTRATLPHTPPRDFPNTDFDLTLFSRADAGLFSPIATIKLLYMNCL